LNLAGGNEFRLAIILAAARIYAPLGAEAHPGRCPRGPSDNTGDGALRGRTVKAAMQTVGPDTAPGIAVANRPPPCGGFRRSAAVSLTLCP